MKKFFITCWVCLSVLCCTGVYAGAAASLNGVSLVRPYSGSWFPVFKTIPDKGRERVSSPGHVTDTLCPQFQVFYPENWKSIDKRPALVIFPGGGYSVLALEKEGTRIAQWANGLGIVAVVVKYRVTDRKSEESARFPGPLLDARQVLRIVRRDAHDMGVLPNGIGVIGFSAGGHLASMTATIWDEKLDGETTEEVGTISSRPDFAMLVYPVISMGDEVGHAWCRHQLFGEHVTTGQKERYSTDKRVTDRTPPLFLVQSKDDSVSCRNSELMEQSAKARGVDVIRILYERGGHGYGMEKRNKPTDAWPGEAARWLESHGWTAQTEKKDR